MSDNKDDEMTSERQDEVTNQDRLYKMSGKVDRQKHGQLSDL